MCKNLEQQYPTNIMFKGQIGILGMCTPQHFDRMKFNKGTQKRGTCDLVVEQF